MVRDGSPPTLVGNGGGGVTFNLQSVLGTGVVIDGSSVVGMS